MNKELEATLVHVLGMPDRWQKQAARAMLPTVYKWQTRISMPHLTEEEFNRQWRASHGPGWLRRIADAADRLPRMPRLMPTAEFWKSTVATSRKLAARLSSKPKMSPRLLLETRREAAPGPTVEENPHRTIQRSASPGRVSRPRMRGTRKGARY